MTDHLQHKLLLSMARHSIAAFATFGLLSAMPAFAADNINGQVLGGWAPIVGSTVTLWAEGTNAPRQLTQTRTGADGRFTLTADGQGANLYLIATGGRPSANAAGGDNPSIALLAVLGNKIPPNVTVNEMTTIASVWTHAQFLDDDAIKGNALGLRSPRATFRTLSILRRAAGAKQFRTRSTAAKRPRWQTSPRWRTCSPPASLVSQRTAATNSSQQRRHPTALPPPTRSPQLSRLLATRGISPRGFSRCLMRFIRYLPAGRCAKYLSCRISAFHRARGCCH